MRRTRNVFLILLLFAPAGAWATTVRPLNLFDMVRLAERVFWGRCLAVELQAEESTGFPLAQYTFEVRRGIKGVATGEKVLFRQSAPAAVGGISGIPQYQKGEEVLLFLHGESDSGLTSPVGLAQGIFRVEKTRERELSVVNSLDNRNLAYRLTRDQVRESGLTTEELEKIQKGDPIPLDVLTSVVEKIDRYHIRRGRWPR